MKKIKISQLPLYSTLKGVFTIGTDSNNRSVKVPLDLVDTAIATANAANAAATAAWADADVAAETANDAAETATIAKTAADNAVATAEAAKTTAESASSGVDEAKETANDAYETAVAASDTADAATAAADNAVATAEAAKTTAESAKDIAYNASTSAEGATETANDAYETAVVASDTADEAIQTARSATEAMQAALAKLIPTGLTVSSVERITFGNKAVKRVEASLTPVGTIPNILFLSDNKAVRINQKGQITVVGAGTSEIQIIPTCNVALAKSITIRVDAPTLRLGSTGNQLRLIGAGAVMFN